VGKASRRKKERIIGHILRPDGKAAPINEEVGEALNTQFEAFKKKFGRYPSGDDPIFFDPDADVPIPIDSDFVADEVARAMRSAGIDEKRIYATRKTGLMPTDENLHLWSEKDHADWKAALDEYDLLGETIQ
jgi:hypothetical protein